MTMPPPPPSPRRSRWPRALAPLVVVLLLLAGRAAAQGGGAAAQVLVRDASSSCHADLLSSPPRDPATTTAGGGAGGGSPTTTTTALGLAFAVSNAGTVPASVSALSASLITQRRFAFALYAAPGPIGPLLGQPLDGTGPDPATGWRLVARGDGVAATDLAPDGDERRIVPFAAFGVGAGAEDDGDASVDLAPGTTTSFYLKLSENALVVEEGEGGIARDAADDGATATGDADLRLHVGAQVRGGDGRRGETSSLLL